MSTHDLFVWLGLTGVQLWFTIPVMVFFFLNYYWVPSLLINKPKLAYLCIYVFRILNIAWFVVFISPWFLKIVHQGVS